MSASRQFAKDDYSRAALKSLLAAVYCVLLGVAASDAKATDMAIPGRISSLDRSLLEPQVEPDCKFKGPVSSPMTAEETRMKLDYEQQCFRQAETNVRGRLDRLQDSVEETIQAVKQREGAASRRQ